jgi:hypothetical protein
VIILAGGLIGGNSYLINEAETNNEKIMKKVDAQAKIKDCQGAKSIVNSNCSIDKKYGYITESAKKTFPLDKSKIKGCQTGAYCNIYGENLKQRILLVGDSHAEDIVFIAKYIAEKLHCRLDFYYLPSGKILTKPIDNSSTVYHNLSKYTNQKNLQFIIFGTVFLKYSSKVLESIKNNFAEFHKKVYYIQDRPNTGNKYTSDATGFWGVQHDCVLFQDSKECKIEKSDYAFTKQQPMFGYKDLLKYQTEQFKIVKTEDLFCDDTYCYTSVGGLNVYTDNYHLTQSYALSMREIVYERLMKLETGKD